MTEQEKHFLKCFLKSKKCYRAFKCNIIFWQKDVSLRYYLNKVSGYHALINAFPWLPIEEEPDWSEINKEWRDFLDTHL
jgi:hypothetical protein